MRRGARRASCDLLAICDITGHSYRSAQISVKHYRVRNAGRADAGIDRLGLQMRKEGMKGSSPAGPEFGAASAILQLPDQLDHLS